MQKVQNRKIACLISLSKMITLHTKRSIKIKESSSRKGSSYLFDPTFLKKLNHLINKIPRTHGPFSCFFLFFFFSFFPFPSFPSFFLFYYFYTNQTKQKNNRTIILREFPNYFILPILLYIVLVSNLNCRSRS